MKKLFVAAAMVSMAMAAPQAEARDQIRIVGSSTVFPFATTVAEQFGRSTSFKTPVIESTGSGGGLKLFCAGLGFDHPDITNASRRIKKSEVELCAKNDIKEIVEVKVGYDGIVLANSKSAPLMSLSLRDIFMATAKMVPDANGNLIANPNMTWDQVNPKLPKTPIIIFGPPPTSGTRDAFAELAMEGGCKTFPAIKDMKKTDKKKYKALCHGVREDGAYVEAGENDNLIVQKLVANPISMGIFGYSFLEQNADKVQGSLVMETTPTFENIASGKYPVSRSLYFYVKKKHVGLVPGIKEYLAEFSSDKAWGDDGYLADKGLIPMPAAERKKFSMDIKELAPLTLE
ncbi:phosphate ABC transporter substrate-binding protein, PhoT family [Magnetococcus marinus MC-1]|uniref:Phosphate ABC transporter substrate-binding protein, PhoT family n=1 Tax=Magnetococcus marinus (strain ATCC BAA-1437 / JCM 17883 / MC-1) TaxID=156889 RepID=A0L7W0_MAGMM|nr:substrate-binding domain-containing protein [Magnetococcus marinus]ABK44053.1 phosphate ABC transporter substrate-binding protein, PhoT family [Magnetococcus marinus MC-1]